MEIGGVHTALLPAKNMDLGSLLSEAGRPPVICFWFSSQLLF